MDSKIYFWNVTEFVEFQSIPTLGAHDWNYFAVDGGHYLVVANFSPLFGSYGTNSTIYKANMTDGSVTSFVDFYNILTFGAFDWHSFDFEGEQYLAVANAREGND